MAPTRPSDGRRLAGQILRFAALLGLAFAAAAAPAEARRASRHATSHAPVHRAPMVLPFEFPNAQYLPVGWDDVRGWRDDDQLPAFKAFQDSCRAVLANRDSVESRTLGQSLVPPCRAARAEPVTTPAAARAFFEAHFVPLRIMKLGDAEGFVTGYYEPEVDGSPVRTDVYTVPVYRRPSNLFVRGFSQSASNLPNKGQVFRKIGRRKLVPYYDRGEIEDGAIAGRGLELCWLKDQTDLLFMQIQGSARVRYEDGTVLRVNYDAHNGYPYTPVGRVLIERNIIPREEMSMQRIRQWMEANPDGAKELRRQNRSYVFFRKVDLAAHEEAVGAQGVHLTAGRSIAVDKSLHVYGTPFFISGQLPIASEQSQTFFHRLMVAQDTGSAIIGPARADLYFGAGPDAGRIAGRIKNGAEFTLLLPRGMDPRAGERTVWMPQPRPAETIARLFPPDDKPAGPPLPIPRPTEPAAAKVDAKPEAKGETKTDAPEVAKPTVQADAVPIPSPRPVEANTDPKPRSAPSSERGRGSRSRNRS